MKKKKKNRKREMIFSYCVIKESSEQVKPCELFQTQEMNT